MGYYLPIREAVDEGREDVAQQFGGQGELRSSLVRPGLSSCSWEANPQGAYASWHDSILDLKFSFLLRLPPSAFYSQ